MHVPTALPARIKGSQNSRLQGASWALRINSSMPGRWLVRNLRGVTLCVSGSTLTRSFGLRNRLRAQIRRRTVEWPYDVACAASERAPAASRSALAVASNSARSR